MIAVTLTRAVRQCMPVAAALALAVAMCAPMDAALAHAHLESAIPAADGASPEVAEIRLTFSEAVEPKLSTIRVETLEERAIVAPGAERLPDNPRSLVVRLYEKLAAGRYRVRWVAVGADGHRMSGAYLFTVSR